MIMFLVDDEILIEQRNGIDWRSRWMGRRKRRAVFENFEGQVEMKV